MALIEVLDVLILDPGKIRTKFPPLRVGELLVSALDDHDAFQGMNEFHALDPLGLGVETQRVVGDVRRFHQDVQVEVVEAWRPETADDEKDKHTQHGCNHYSNLRDPLQFTSFLKKPTARSMTFSRGRVPQYALPDVHFRSILSPKRHISNSFETVVAPRSQGTEHQPTRMSPPGTKPTLSSPA
jgi:hypothetical protein